MKRTTLALALMLLTGLSAFAGGIRFLENKKWKDVLALARSQHKPVFLDAYASWCGPCRYMKESVFTQAMVGDWYNARFINVKMDMEEGEGPGLAQALGIEAYPTFFFLNEKGEVVHKSVGALSAVAFVELGRLALNPDRQFYSLQHKAEAGQLSPAAFHRWLAEAEQLDAGAIDSTVARYLRRANYPLLDSDMLHILVDYAQAPSRAQVDFLFAHREEVAQRLRLNSAELERSLLRKLRGYALALSSEADSVDFPRFEGIVQQYAPASAWVETQRLRTAWQFSAGQKDQAMGSLLELVQRPGSGLFAEDLSDLVLAQAARIGSHPRAPEVVRATQAFVLRPDEPKPYYRTVALLVLALKQGDADAIRSGARALYDDPAVPAELRERVKDLRE